MSKSGNKRGPARLKSTVNPMNLIATPIQVVRRLRSGWHVYTCDALPGLYVASKDDKKAYNDVPAAIKLLFKLDHGCDVSVHHVTDYASFMAQIEMGRRAREDVEARTRDMMDSHQDVLSFMIGSTHFDLAAGRN